VQGALEPVHGWARARREGLEGCRRYGDQRSGSGLRGACGRGGCTRGVVRQADPAREVSGTRRRWAGGHGLSRHYRDAPRAPGANPGPFPVQWRNWPDAQGLRHAVALWRPWANVE
jgi:hypothetical protein